jgi:hypothetical protein
MVNHSFLLHLSTSFPLLLFTFTFYLSLSTCLPLSSPCILLMPRYYTLQEANETLNIIRHSHGGGSADSEKDRQNQPEAWAAIARSAGNGREPP